MRRVYALFGVLLVMAAGRAQGTAFTYQGRLEIRVHQSDGGAFTTLWSRQKLTPATLSPAGGIGTEQ